jgi:ATP-dependent RNA helicase DHX36
MRRGLRRGLGIFLVPLPSPLSRPPPPPVPLAALLLLPRRLDAFSLRSFCGYGGGRAVEQFSDDEYDHEYEDHRVLPLRRTAISVARS